MSASHYRNFFHTGEAGFAAMASVGRSKRIPRRRSSLRLLDHKTAMASVGFVQWVTDEGARPITAVPSIIMSLYTPSDSKGLFQNLLRSPGPRPSPLFSLSSAIHNLISPSIFSSKLEIWAAD